MKKPLLLLIISLLMGAIFLISGTFVLSNKINLHQSGVEIEGTVVDLKKHNTKRSDTYIAVIEFATKEGQIVTFDSSSSSNPPAYSIGEKVNIIYSKDNPENCSINSRFEIFGLPVIFIFSGIALILLGVILIKKQRAA